MSSNCPLNGFDLVEKGITKYQAVLPALGLKDVTPSGSWLEQKQIQAAIDTRKQLISAERIEKSSSLSHAEWREHLMLAEVTQNVGGHWQFMGHNVGKKLFLYPEETLFLIDTNCLLLKHNNVKVSVQQAYSLLFKDNISLVQYMVYASLSRLGYKVLRHKVISQDKSNSTQREESIDDISNDINEINKNKGKDDTNTQKNVLKSNSTENDHNANIPLNTSDNPESEILKVQDTASTSNTTDDSSNIYQRQIQMIRSRIKPFDSRKLNKYFRNIPNILNCETITVTVPDGDFLPNHVEFNKTVYTLNIKAIRSKSGRRGSRRYSVGNEKNVSMPRIRVIREGTIRNIPQNSQYQNDRYFSPRQAPYPQICTFNIWRPPFHDFYAFQRPTFSGMFFAPRMNLPRNYFARPPVCPPNSITEGSRKRSRSNAQSYHLESIKRLAARLQRLTRTFSAQPQNHDALEKLIQTYNNRYGASISLTDDYQVVDNDRNLETIELDDEESSSKKPRLDGTYEANLNEIKELAARLKELESENKATARHRRAFASLVRTFNKSYAADIYVNGDYKVFDKICITLESSSDSDCVVEEQRVGSGKKLRNPFNVLKRLSEKRNERLLYNPCVNNDRQDPVPNYTDKLSNNISNGWLPNENDFGRPAIPKIKGIFTDNLIYNYSKYHPKDWNNWQELKIAYLSSCEEGIRAFVKDTSEWRSIVKPEDCTDMVTVMKKLSVIKSADDSSKGTTLKIVYDVYNRDVQNFKKSTPPTPHFRVLCFDQTTCFPTGEQIGALYSKYGDEVPIVFAIVHEGSISYLQIKNTNLPMYFCTSSVS